MKNCDLCHSPHSEQVLSLPRAMYSDRRPIEMPLNKVFCSKCGLVRGQISSDVPEINSFYNEDYQLVTYTDEHFFYTPQGAVARSQLFCDWITQAMGIQHWRGQKRCLEIGAGAGHLLKMFMERFPEMQFEGVELSQQAVQHAQASGLPVTNASLESLPPDHYDLAYSIAVLEHVPSPSQFLEGIWRTLKPGGLLFLSQPTQDVESYDLFFYDHLHHFGNQHLRAYAEKCGFKELGFVTGQEWMPNFSLHLWQKQTQNPFDWVGIPALTTCLQTAQNIQQDLQHLNSLLETLKGNKVAVFGVGEAYWLLYTYSDLWDFPILCGLDDNPIAIAHKRLGFPVIRPQDAAAYGVEDVLLTMNKVYYPAALERMTAYGLNVHPVFDSKRN